MPSPRRATAAKFLLGLIAVVAVLGVLAVLFPKATRRPRQAIEHWTSKLTQRLQHLPQTKRAMRWVTAHLPHRKIWHTKAADHTPKLTYEDRRIGFVVFQRSTLLRLERRTKPREGEHATHVALTAAWNEYEPFQIGVFAARDLRQLRVTVSELHNDNAEVLPASAIEVRLERDYAVPLSIRKGGHFGVVPKTLEVASPIDVPHDTTRAFWVTVHVPEHQPPGLYKGTIALADVAGYQSLELQLRVLPLDLQEPDILYGPLSLTVLRNLPSGRKPELRQTMLRDADTIFRDIREHGMNTMSLWSGKLSREQHGEPQLDDLDAALELYKKYKFTKPLIYAPVNLLRTNKINRSQNYRGYVSSDAIPLAQRIARTYTQKAQADGMPGIIFDVIEEPNLRSGIAPGDPIDIRQTIAKELLPAMKAAGATTAMTCTPDSIRPVADSVDYWIVAYQRFTPQIYEMAAAHHAHLALYANATLTGNGTYFSRFFFGYFAWANHLSGVLAWTYPLAPKRFPTNVGGRGEGGLHVVDGFLGSDGKPIPTIQWELAREGIDDAKYLATIESLLPVARRAGTTAASQAADAASAFLGRVRALVRSDPRQYVFENPKTFEAEPSMGWDAARFDAVRTESAQVLTALLDASSP